MAVEPETSYPDPVTETDRCGEVLDYDLDFLELDMAIRGKPGQEFGNSSIAAEPPDWVEVSRLVSSLSIRSKDLRVGVASVRAVLNNAGLSGFRDAIENLATLVTDFWIDVHPRPDADEAEDQVVRLNALAELCDPEGLVAELRRAPLTQSHLHGVVTLADWLETQRQTGGPPSDKKMEIGTIESGFRDTPIDLLSACSGDLAAALAAVRQIDGEVCKHVGGFPGSRFEPLTDVLRQMLRLVDDHRPEAVRTDETKAATPFASSDEIRNRNDIISMLDRICRWYHVNEPASPVPALLDRTKRLVAKDFMALLLELAPAGAIQFQNLAGLPQDKA